MLVTHSSTSAVIADLRWDCVPVPDRDWGGRAIPVIRPCDVVDVDGRFDYWDAWPLLSGDGEIHRRADGGEIWFALAAQRGDDPDNRHDIAAIHTLVRRDGGFFSLGPTLPAGHGPGSRQWSGSATLDTESGLVRLFYTAAGVAGEPRRSFAQRIVCVTGRVDGDDVGAFGDAHECVIADGHDYQLVGPTDGVPGMIKGFRDPEFFRDPATGREWLTFTASSARAPGTHDGVVGIAALDSGRMVARQLPPIVDGTGFCNELERPHLRIFDSTYYLFWCSQGSVFAPGVIAPSGLYGACAESLDGPWSLVNGDGLIAANPPEEPRQAYAWLVLPDGSVTSFVDRWGMSGRKDADLPNRRCQFGGTFAPFFRLAFSGGTIRLVA